MEDYEKLLAIGTVILVSPFLHPFLVLLNDSLHLVVPIGFVTIILGAILLVSENN